MMSFAAGDRLRRAQRWAIGAGACRDGRAWLATRRGPAAAWRECRRLDWVQWVLCNADVPRRTLFVAAVALARAAAPSWPRGRGPLRAALRIAERAAAGLAWSASDAAGCRDALRAGMWSTTDANAWQAARTACCLLDALLSPDADADYIALRHAAHSRARARDGRYPAPSRLAREIVAVIPYAAIEAAAGRAPCPTPKERTAGPSLGDIVRAEFPFEEVLAAAERRAAVRGGGS